MGECNSMGLHEVAGAVVVATEIIVHEVGDSWTSHSGRYCGRADRWGGRREGKLTDVLLLYRFSNLNFYKISTKLTQYFVESICVGQTVLTIPF